jgi:3-keto-5-aminohexanoate cleavage enzyme
VDDLIICVAPYPSEHQDEKFPGRMDVAREVIRSHDSGASLAHLHVRDDDGNQVADTRWFARDVRRIKESCPVIIEGSTGGAPEHTLAQRCVSFTVAGVDMGSLNLGSVNMFGGVFQNSWPDIRYYAGELRKRGLMPYLDVFDLSHFSSVARLEKDGLLSAPYVFGFVLDTPDTLPYSDRYLAIFKDELPAASTWFLHRHQPAGSRGFLSAMEMGGHVRVGFENGPFLSDGRRARSNAELVDDVVEAARQVGRNVVGPDRAREIMGLPPRAK